MADANRALSFDNNTYYTMAIPPLAPPYTVFARFGMPAGATQTIWSLFNSAVSNAKSEWRASSINQPEHILEASNTTVDLAAGVSPWTHSATEESLVVLGLNADGSRFHAVARDSSDGSTTDGDAPAGGMPGDANRIRIGANDAGSNTINDTGVVHFLGIVHGVVSSTVWDELKVMTTTATAKDPALILAQHGHRLAHYFPMLDRNPLRDWVTGAELQLTAGAFATAAGDSELIVPTGSARRARRGQR